VKQLDAPEGRGQASLKPTFLSLACAACGALIQSKFDLEIGNLVVGELVLIGVAFVVLFLPGKGDRVRASTIWLYGAGVLVMLLGYVASDLYAQTEPQQYVRGWARVMVFGLDVIALLVIASRGERHLWWFAAGLAAGMAGYLLASGTRIDVLSWKQGYGFAVVIFSALIAGFWNHYMGALLFACVGIFSVLFDFRSLGGTLVVSACLLFARVAVRNPPGRWAGRVIVLGLMLGAAALALVVSLLRGDVETDLRRQESNVGRFVGLTVAGRAIADSPLLGYGSWTGDKRYVDLLNRELARATFGTEFRVAKRIDSLLPHSQVLQAWVEGGLLGALFFLIYGVQLLVGLHWLAFHHVPGRLTPLYLFFLVSGFWNLLASPFLGVHRVYIACAIAVLALLSRERRTAAGAAPGSRVIELQRLRA